MRKILFLLIFFGSLIFIHLRLSNYAFDDAYIHFRIAKHFVENGYPYFNLKEPVMASSSSGWTLVLFIIFSLFGAKPVVVACFNAVCTGIGAVVFYYLFLKITHPEKPDIFSYMMPILYVSAILSISIGLMEIPFSIAVFGLAILLFLKKNPVSILLFAALPFFRVEFFFISALFLGYALVRKYFPIKSILIFSLLGFLPFFLYDLFYFHTIIPNAVAAKSQAYEITYKRVYSDLLTGLLPLNNIFSFNLSQWKPLIFIILMIILGILIIRNRNALRFPVVFLLISSLLVCSFYLVGKALIFEWYLPILSIPLIMGIMCIFSKENWVIKTIPILLFLPLIIAPLKTVYAAVTDQPQYYQYFAVNARVRQYISTGERLYKRYPQARLATSEIGGLGWGFQGYIADGLGLATPEAIKFQTKSHGSLGILPLAYIQYIQPEIIVSMDLFNKEFENSPLINHYRLISEPIYLPDDLTISPEKKLWGASQTNIFIRNDLYTEKNW